MRAIYFILILVLPKILFSQLAANDFDAILSKSFEDTTYTHSHKASYVFKNSNAIVKYNPVSLVFGGALLFYQRVVSKQIMMGCAFNPSCSNFSKQSIKQFGLLKGIALSTDRLTRCTKLSSIDFHPVLFDENGKVNDSPSFYKLQ